MHICTLIYIYYINNTCNTHYTYTYEQINSPAPFTTSPPNLSMFFIYLVPIPQNLALLPPQSFTSQNFSFSLTTPNKNVTYIFHHDFSLKSVPFFHPLCYYYFVHPVPHYVITTPCPIPVQPSSQPRKWQQHGLRHRLASVTNMLKNMDTALPLLWGQVWGFYYDI